LEFLVISDLDGPVTDFLQTFIVPALRSLTIPESFIEPNPMQLLKFRVSQILDFTKSRVKLNLTGQISMHSDTVDIDGLETRHLQPGNQEQSRIR
jgi:hypothetical protein